MDDLIGLAIAIFILVKVVPFVLDIVGSAVKNLLTLLVMGVIIVVALRVMIGV